MARRNDADESTNTNGGRSSSKKRSNAGATILGLSAIIAVTALAVLFGRSAVDAMNRNANAQLAKTQQELDDMRSRNQPQEPETEEVETGYRYDWTTNQLEWAHDKHIKWDEYGNPVDENNIVTDDPTTLVNEVERARANGTLADDGTSRAPVIEEPEPEPEETEEPETEEETEDTSYIDELLKNPNISQEEDGTLIYTVQRGQTVSDIARETGYSVAELAEYNNLESASMIITGQKLKLPPHPPTSEIGVSGAGLG